MTCATCLDAAGTSSSSRSPLGKSKGKPCASYPAVCGTQQQTALHQNTTRMSPCTASARCTAYTTSRSSSRHACMQAIVFNVYMHICSAVLVRQLATVLEDPERSFLCPKTVLSTLCMLMSSCSYYVICVLTIYLPSTAAFPLWQFLHVKTAPNELGLGWYWCCIGARLRFRRALCFRLWSHGCHTHALPSGPSSATACIWLGT